jgi:hypothetical protein
MLRLEIPILGIASPICGDSLLQVKARSQRDHGAITARSRRDHGPITAQVKAQPASVEMTYAYGTFLTTKTGTSYT